MNYMQYSAPQGQYGNMARPPYQPNNGWNNSRIRPVSSIEEVRAASIDFDGSVFYFSDLANKRIYTKQIGMDRTAQLNMYELKETPIMEQPIVDTSNFVTRDEFDTVMKQIKELLVKPEQLAETEKPKEEKEKPKGFVF